ncbi:hypothetical protein JCM33374_g6015 [Metschnikowia sp. JCM 33374]|nr:hypothetical protein JCM33374_g6015 [Metschnikowia sp. JCM 33374]
MVFPSTAVTCKRSYATEKPANKPTKKAVDKGASMTTMPIKAIGVVSDYYVPPRFLSSPVTSWPKLLFKRIGLFGLNTYSVSRFKNDTKLKLQFNDWKESAVDKYVKTNKIFAAACSLPISQRQSYVQTQLDGIAGTEVIKALTARVRTFPIGSKLKWNLLSVEKNPKLVVFVPIPDGNDVTTLVQFVVQVKTKQEMIVSGDASPNPSRTEKIVTDNIVLTMNPYTDEVVFVGTIFDSDHIRGLKPQMDMNDVKALELHLKECADIYRAPPKQNL